MYKGTGSKKDKSFEKWKLLKELDPFTFADQMENYIDPKTKKPIKLKRVAMKIGHYVG